MHMAWLNQANSLERAPDMVMVARAVFLQSNVSFVKEITDMCRLFRLERRDGLTVLVPSSSPPTSSSSSGKEEVEGVLYG
jgi:hypothetical protein